jgi:hypothetical protein
MSRPAWYAAPLALVAILAILWVPAYVTKSKVTDDPSAQILDSAYKIYEANLPNFKVDRKKKVTDSVPREGGGRTEFTCARILKGGTGWICFALSADNRGIIAGWTAPKPNLDNATFLIGKPSFLSRPGDF